MLEIRISPVQITHDALFEAVVRLQRAGLRPFLEIAERPDREEKASEIIAWMGAFNSENSACPPVGFKLRCGGIIPEAIPSSERVARVLAACRDRNVPFKATAGLHHPVRGYSRELGAMTHGFVNLFGAGILSRIHGLNQNQIQAVLDEVSPAHFIFSGSAFSWKDLAATQEQIAEARRSAALSFGSCSFDEPREDLEKLGWL